jgi:uncharacterized protein YukE
LKYKNKIVLKLILKIGGKKMANLTLLVDSDEMRVTANAIQTLTEDFDNLRETLKAAIGEELNTACAGDVADEFTRYYNENIDTQLVAERERLEGVIATLRATADNFDSTAAAVKSAF